MRMYYDNKNKANDLLFALLVLAVARRALMTAFEANKGKQAVGRGIGYNGRLF
jgi:hypothetical protein